MEIRRIYQNAIIIKGEFTEKQYKKSLAKIKRNIPEIKKIKEFGIRRLSYPVDKNKEGYFVVFELKATEKETKELEKYYRVNSDVLKFIIIRKDRK